MLSRPLPVPTILAAAIAGLFAAPLHAQTPDALAKADSPTLDTVTITATREARKDEEVAHSVSVIDDAEKQRRLVNDIRDLIRYEPGVSVRNAPSRFTAAGSSTGRDGNAGFTIRGIEGNQILMQADGVRLPLAFSFGPIGYGRGDYLDLEAYKSIEILRGPASTLYGSDGLAGAVSFITKEPSDFLGGTRNFYGAVKGAYASADESALGSFTLAGRQGAFEGLLVYAAREGHETETKGDNAVPNSTRTVANPQDVSSNSLLAKAIWRGGAEHLVRVTGERFRREVDTEVLSGRAPPPLAATSVIDLDAQDDIRRDRVSLDYEFASAAGPGKRAIDRAKLTLYRQDARNFQNNQEDRSTAADRQRNNTYKEEATGGSVALHSTFSTGNLAHRLVYGGDYSTTDVFGLRDGVTPPAGESLPSKPFPDTKYKLFGLFAQDEILLGDHFALIPGLRWDGFDLDPRTGDPQYPTLGGQPVSLDGHETSPKLGAIWKLAPALSAFAQYAEGYRAPTPSQVNQGFENQVANYRSIGNPDLQPETSRTLEAGLRGRGENYTWDLVAFDGRYKNFIAQIQIAGAFTPANPAVFQNANLSKVKITGFEARGKYAFGQGFTAFGNFSSARGQDESLDQALLSIDPPKLVLGGEFARERWGVQAYVTRYWEKKSDRIPPAPATGPGAPPAYYAAPAATIFDVYAYWRLTRGLTLNAAAFNLSDRKYWVWGDVRGQLATSTTLDAFTSSGRSYSVSLKYEF